MSSGPPQESTSGSRPPAGWRRTTSPGALSLMPTTPATRPASAGWLAPRIRSIVCVATPAVSSGRFSSSRRCGAVRIGRRKETKMRTLNAVEFLTVDGVMQGLGSPDEDTEGGFTHGGWGAPYADAIHEAVATSGPNHTAAYLFGRRTYDKMAAFWPFQPEDNPMARQLNQTPKFVATRTVTDLDWNGAHILEGDLETAVTDLKSHGEG